MKTAKSTVFLVIAMGCVVLLAASWTGLASTGPWLDKWLGTYRMQHSGWKGTLSIEVPTVTTYEGPNLQITYTGDDGLTYTGYGYVQGPSYPSGPELVDPLEFVIDNAAASIGIRFYIDFPNSPEEPGDDPMFIGYLMDSDRMAGFVQNPGYYRSFGWYAIRKGAPGSVW